MILVEFADKREKATAFEHVYACTYVYVRERVIMRARCREIFFARHVEFWHIVKRDLTGVFFKKYQKNSIWVRKKPKK